MHNLTLSEFINEFEARVRRCRDEARYVPVDVCVEAINRLDECAGRLDQISEIANPEGGL